MKYHDKRLHYVYDIGAGRLVLSHFFHTRFFLKKRYQRLKCKRCSRDDLDLDIIFTERSIRVSAQCFCKAIRDFVLRIAAERFYDRVIDAEKRLRADVMKDSQSRSTLNCNWEEIETPIRKLVNMVAREKHYSSDELLQQAYIFWHRFDSTYDPTKKVPYKTYILRMLKSYLEFYIYDLSFRKKREVTLEYTKHSGFEEKLLDNEEQLVYRRAFYEHYEKLPYEKRQLLSLFLFGLNATDVAFVLNRKVEEVQEEKQKLLKSLSKL